MRKFKDVLRLTNAQKRAKSEARKENKRRRKQGAGLRKAAR